MEIYSKGTYPANKLTNFAPNAFIIDGIFCASMEGFLQSLKFKNSEMQKEICQLIGSRAKNAGRNKNWKRDGLYWQGQKIDRYGEEYQELLDRAYNSILQNTSFQAALLASGNATLTHNMGKQKESETILTRTEFVGRLTKMRAQLQKEKNVV